MSRVISQEEFARSLHIKCPFCQTYQELENRENGDVEKAMPMVPLFGFGITDHFRDNFLCGWSFFKKTHEHTTKRSEMNGHQI